MKYMVNDSVLPAIGFSASPVNIEIDIDDKNVKLTVGNRDFIWDKETGVHTGSGCCGPFEAKGTPALNQGNSADSLQQPLNASATPSGQATLPEAGNVV